MKPKPIAQADAKQLKRLISSLKKNAGAGEVQEQYNEMMNLYTDIKRQVQQLDPHLYERWKAGGFLVDDDIVSMYPSLGSVVEDLQDLVEFEEEEEEEDDIDIELEEEE